MNTKKHPHANVYRYRGLFFRIGLVISLSLVILAFQWPTYIEIKPIGVDPHDDWKFDPVVIPPTAHKKTPMPEPPKTSKNIKITTENILPEDSVDDVKDDNDLPDIPVDIDTDPVVDWVPYEDQAVFPHDLIRWISNKVKYPDKDRELGIEGTVFVQFVVGKKGIVRDIMIIRSPSKSLGNEVIRIIKLMPKWKPAKQRGKPVSIRMSLPVMFTLN